jgi:hypothetical protein
MNCEECGEPVTLGRNDRLLNVSCECSERSIKVATVLPDGWSA